MLGLARVAEVLVGVVEHEPHAELRAQLAERLDGRTRDHHARRVARVDQRHHLHLPPAVSRARLVRVRARG